VTIAEKKRAPGCGREFLPTTPKVKDPGIVPPRTILCALKLTAFGESEATVFFRNPLTKKQQPYLSIIFEGVNHGNYNGPKAGDQVHGAALY
jgi:hypothetical protein